MALKQQSAVEFISTYSFSMFIISLMLVAATTISLSLGSGTAPVYSTCSIQPLIYCQQSLLTYNSVGGYFTYILAFRNNLGFLLQFPANALNLTTSSLVSSGSRIQMGSCAPTIAPQGSQVICIATVAGRSQVKQGASLYTQFRLTYGLCSNQSVSTCTSNTYSATGYSFQTLSPPTSNLYSISVSSSNGIVVVNGQSYLNNTVVYLTGGAYTLYAQPNSGYHFISWSWTGSGSSLSTTSASNTILTLNSNGNVVVVFTH